MKKSLLAMAACAMMASSVDATVYIVGDPAGRWSPTVGIAMEEADGGWKWTGTIAEDQWFAFATELMSSDDWSTFNSTYRLNPPVNDDVAGIGDFQLTLGGKDQAFKGSGQELTFLVKESAGSYSLTVSDPSGVEPSPMYIIGAPAGEWGFDIGIKMTPVDGGWKWTGYIGENEYFAFATQLVDEESLEEGVSGWDVMNQNYRLSPDGGNDTEATLGVHGLRFGTPEGAFHGIGSKLTYLVNKTDSVYTLTVSLPNGIVLPENAVWGVVGQFNNWGSDSSDFKMTKVRDGVWKATINDFSGEFKFRADYSWDFNFGPSEIENINANGVYRVGFNTGNFKIEEEMEEVVFELDLNNFTLNVSGFPTSEVNLALRGSFNGWGYDEAYFLQEADDDVYTIKIESLPKDSQFKIANEDFGIQYSTGVLDMKAGEIYPINLGTPDNMGVDEAYTDVTLTLNVEGGYITFYGEVDSSVAANEIAAGKARYFNLQGCEVTNPSKGIFIRVVNGRSEKVTVK